MSSSRNTSDSWVKKATGGLSPGSMAPLSSAVNMAASAYGVGFGSLRSFSLLLLCILFMRVNGVVVPGMKNNGYIFCPFRIFLNFNGDERERESRACEELPLKLSRRRHRSRKSDETFLCWCLSSSSFLFPGLKSGSFRGGVGWLFLSFLYLVSLPKRERKSCFFAQKFSNFFLRNPKADRKVFLKTNRLTKRTTL